MRAKCALIGFWLTGKALFAADALGVREYSEQCVSYFAQMYDVSPALVRAVIPNQHTDIVGTREFI
jgi:hypothetical protein